MKKSKVFVALAVALFFTYAAACHALLVNAAQSDTPAAAEPYGSPLNEKLPSRFVCAPVSGTNIEVTADAEIVAPATGTLPVATVEPHMFTLAECSRFAQALFAGQKMYAGGRMEKEARTAALKEKLRGDPRNTEWICQLQQVQAELAALPEHAVRFEEAATWNDSAWAADVSSDGSDGLFRRLQCGADPEISASYLLYTASEKGEPHIGNVWSTTSGAASRQAQSFGLTGGELPHHDGVPQPAITEEDAASAAEATILKLGLTDYSLRSTDLVYGRINGCVQKGWLLNYTRTVAGVPVTLSFQNHGGFRAHSLPPEERASNGHWTTEVLEFLVCGAGIVRMTWECPFDVSKITTEGTSLQPFDRVEKIFAEMAPALCDSAIAGMTRERIAVTQVNLSLERVAGENKLTPAWCFYGARFLLSGETVTEITRSGDNPLLILDALTGAVLA